MKIIVFNFDYNIVVYDKVTNHTNLKLLQKELFFFLLSKITPSQNILISVKVIS